MGDYFNQPQIKAHLDIQINDNWRFWGRYVTESSDYIQAGAQKILIDGKYRDFRMSRFRYFQLALENNADISDNWSLKSTFGLSSTDIRDIQQSYVLTGNPENNLRNYGWIYSEWEYFTRFMLNYEPKDSKLKAAIGFELSYDTIRPSWGKNADDGLRLSKGIMSGPSSQAYGAATGQYDVGDPEYFPVGKGWETFTHSFIGELNYQLTPKTTMILSARMDKHSYTNY